MSDPLAPDYDVRVKNLDADGALVVNTQTISSVTEIQVTITVVSERYTNHITNLQDTVTFTLRIGYCLPDFTNAVQPPIHKTFYVRALPEELNELNAFD